MSLISGKTRSEFGEFLDLFYLLIAIKNISIDFQFFVYLYFRAVKRMKETEKQKREAAMIAEMESRKAQLSVVPSTAVELSQAVSGKDVTVSSEEAYLQVLNINT